MRTGRMPHDEHSPGIATPIPAIVKSKSDRPGNRFDLIGHFDFGNQFVVHRHEGESHIRTSLQLTLDMYLVASDPTAAMDPNHHGMIDAGHGSVHVSSVCIVRRTCDRQIIEHLHRRRSLIRFGDPARQEIRKTRTTTAIEIPGTGYSACNGPG